MGVSFKLLLCRFDSSVFWFRRVCLGGVGFGYWRVWSFFLGFVYFFEMGFFGEDWTGYD